MSLETLIKQNKYHLNSQDALLYQSLISQVMHAEQSLFPQKTELSTAVAQSYFKLLISKKSLILLKEYQARVQEILDHLSHQTYELAVQLAEVPSKYTQEAKQIEAALLGPFRSLAYQKETLTNSKK